MRVKYVQREMLGPAFGIAYVEQQVALVREDLPPLVKDFVKLHEMYHLKDNAGWWVWREVKASGAGALKQPLGFLLCVLLSLAPYRLNYYWKRISGRGRQLSEGRKQLPEGG